MADAILQVDDLRTHFATEEGVARVLDGVNFEMARGKIVGLVGGSGSGKSLLIASILNMVRPPGQLISGSVRFDGRELRGLREQELRKVRGREISLIGPNPHTLLNPLVPVGKQVAKFLTAHKSVPRQEAMEQTIKMFRAVGIPDPERRLRAYPHELSGGMAQRVIISVGLICSPRLILADEPTFGLDVTIQAQVLELMSDLVSRHGERAMLLVTRDLGIVANYCDSILVLDEGRIVESGTVSEFFQGPVTSQGRILLEASRLTASSEALTRLADRRVPDILADGPGDLTALAGRTEDVINR